MAPPKKPPASHMCAFCGSGPHDRMFCPDHWLVLPPDLREGIGRHAGAVRNARPQNKPHWQARLDGHVAIAVHKLRTGDGLLSVGKCVNCGGVCPDRHFACRQCWNLLEPCMRSKVRASLTTDENCRKRGARPQAVSRLMKHVRAMWAERSAETRPPSIFD